MVVFNAQSLQVFNLVSSFSVCTVIAMSKYVSHRSNIFLKHKNYRYVLDVSVLPFLKKGPLLLKLFLLTPKPPRLLKIKTGMEPKVLWREATPLSHLP
jgi:hypothetical protein